MKKKYYIKSITDIHEHDYNEGQGKFLSCYSNTGTVEAKTPKEAIQVFAKTFLELSSKYNDDYAISIFNIVDGENHEVDSTSQKYEQWKNGEIELHSCNSAFEIFEMVKIESIYKI